MKYLLIIFSFLIFLFSSCNQIDNKNNTDFFNKTIENFKNLSDSFIIQIYLDFDADKENKKKEELYRCAYDLRLKTNNLTDLIDKNNNTLVQDSLPKFKDFLKSSIDSNDKLMINFINNQLDIENLDLKNEMDLIKIKTDIIIIKFALLNYLYNNE